MLALLTRLATPIMFCLPQHCSHSSIQDYIGTSSIGQEPDSEQLCEREIIRDEIDTSY